VIVVETCLNSLHECFVFVCMFMGFEFVWVFMEFD